MTFGISKPNGAAAAKKAKSLLEPYLSNALGERVRVDVLDDYDALARALSSGKVDLAWITPVAFVKAVDSNPEVHAMAKAQRGGQPFYRAAFIVKRESPAKSLEDLKKKKVAWVSKASASGYAFAHAIIESTGQDSAHFFSAETFEGDHPAVCRAVREGRADVGATHADPSSSGAGLRADGCEDAPPVEDFRVVVAGGPIPNDVIAARPGLDSIMQDSVSAGFQRMKKGAAGRDLLNEVFRVEDWIGVGDDDFQTVKAAMSMTADLPNK
jgi:phosphonate transport system substrate-binding protein